MTTSKKVQNAIKNYLSDHKNHSTKEMKDYLNSQNLQYTEGHFSGSVNTLLQNGSIKKSIAAYTLLRTTDHGMPKL